MFHAVHWLQTVFLPPTNHNIPLCARSSSLLGLHDHTQDTPTSVELPSTSDQLVVNNSNSQNTTHSRDRLTCSRRDSNQNPRKPTPANTRLIPRGHWHCLQKLTSTFRSNLHCRTYIYTCRRSEQFIVRKITLTTCIFKYLLSICVRKMTFMSYKNTKYDLRQSCSVGVKEGMLVGVRFPHFVTFVEGHIHSA